MKKIIYSIFGICAISLLDSCTPKLVIDYQTIAVPEEGGIRFTQFTRDEETVMGPYIGRNAVTNILEWYAAPLIALSPDGEQIAFIAKKNDKDNLFLKNTGGGRSTIQRTFRDNVMDMAYSPDGKNIAFTDSRGAESNIYVINATQGAAVQQVTTTTSSELGPTYAIDGKSIFFTKQEGGRYYIWNVNLETSLLTQYAAGFTPAITPEGNTMVVTRNNASNRGEIWTIDLNIGTETLILTDPVKGFSSPQVSPDGKLIVVVGTSEKTTTTPENLNIYTFRPDGTNLTQLTFHPGHDVSPVWSVDGTSIYFISQRGNPTGKYNVWRMGVNTDLL